MSENDETMRDVANTGAGGGSRKKHSADMTVPGAQVQTFLSTLQDYSDKCTAAKTVVENALVTARKNEAEGNKNGKKVLTEVKKIRTEVVKLVEKHREEIKSVQHDMEEFYKRAEECKRQFVVVRGAEERFGIKESMICSYADITKESERMTRQIYTRSLYAGTICREIATAALNTLEGTIRLLQVQIDKAQHTPIDTKDDLVMDGISSNSGKTSLSSLASDMLVKVRYLKHDVQTVERAAELMEEVGLLDKTLRVSTGEIKGVCLNYDDLKEQRRRMEGMVRMSMVYDEGKHGSKADFDELVTAETNRRLSACGVEGSSLVSAVVSTLKRDGPLNPGNLPVDAADNLNGAGPSSGQSSSDGSM